MFKRFLTILLVLAFLPNLSSSVALSENKSTTDPDWPMFGRTPDGNRIVEPGYGLPSTQLCKLWETKFVKVNFASPVVWENSLYQSDNGNLYCIDFEDRSIKWVYESEFCENYSHAVDSGKVYLDNYHTRKRENRIICLDATNGKFIWEYLSPTDEYINYPIQVYQNRIYASYNNGNLVCLDGSSGKVLWTLKNEFTLAPVFGNNCVYLPGIKCLDATTGKVVWENKISMFENLVIDDIKLVSVEVDKDKVNITTFSAETGDKIDSFLWVTTDKIQMVRNLSIVNNKLYVSTLKTFNLHAQNAIFCFDLKTKKLLWSLDTGDHMLCCPTFDNGNIVVGSNLGTIMFIDMNTGKIVQTYNIDQPIGYELVIASKKLFVPTKKALFCFEGEM